MKENKEQKQEQEEKVITLDTMANVGKPITLAGREYIVCPVNIADMYMVINAGELYIPVKTNDDEEDAKMSLQLVGLNITDEKRAKNLFKIIEKYVRYKNIPVTKEMVEEHNWSFQDIKDFLLFWAQISD